MRLLLATYCFSLICSVVRAAQFQVGVAPNTPVDLTKADFSTAIQDPANSLWLLKFYAPWCGHCKRMAPTLEKVAGPLSGKMSIGKIDCTTSDGKPLCKEHGVRGFPTLMFSLDGQLYDYPGGRDEDAILQFANKMSRPVVSSVASVQEAYKIAAEEGEDGVAFVAYHPSTSGSTIEEKLQSNLLTQIYAQVARKEKAFGTFLLLETPASDSPGEALGTAPEGPFMCRLEENVSPRCMLIKEGEELTLESMLDFVTMHNIPTAARLGPHNFHKIGHSGRPMVIGVVADEQDEEQVALVKRILADYATKGPEAIRDKYTFGWFNGKKWARFLEQFNVQPDELPQILVLDAPSRTFWQDASYKLNIEDFLQAVEDGTIESKSAQKKGLEGFLKKVLSLVVEYAPWSVAALVLLLVAFFVLLASFLSPAEELRPPYKKESDPSSADGEKNGKQEESNEGNAEGKETKKDK